MPPKVKNPLDRTAQQTLQDLRKRLQAAVTLLSQAQAADIDVAEENAIAAALYDGLEKLNRAFAGGQTVQ